MKRRLYKTKKDKVFSGVCGGISEYCDVDSVLVRVGAFLIILLTNWVGLFIYIFLAVLLPEKSSVTTSFNEAESKKSEYEYENFGCKGEFKDDYDFYTSHKKKNSYDMLKSNDGVSKIFGILLVILGIIFIVDRFIPINFRAIDYIVPVTFVVFGGFILYNSRKKDEYGR